MASTADGRALTEQHKAQQLRLAMAASIEARALWTRLDPEDLDGSMPYWLASSTAVVNRRVRESQAVASSYLTEFRSVEIGSPGRVVLGEGASTALALRVAGPIRVKQLIAGGMDRFDAFTRAFTKFEGIVQRQVLMGGRVTVARTAQADRRAVGWRRVTDGNPCAFCAMLAARGPQYRDAAAADGLKYHAHCGCSAEPAYSNVWEPTADEERYVQAYTDARGSDLKRSTAEVLKAMRASGGFRDSPRS